MIIGYTTGVYDLFHIGHLNLLKEAKRNCDQLVVGVTTDELCLSVKNKTPFIDFEERVQILESLRCVDRVVPQDTMDKMEAWKIHQFNRMFVGDDWKGSKAWNKIEEDFKDVEVEVCYFAYTQKTSSSALRKALEKINSEVVG